MTFEQRVVLDIICYLVWWAVLICGIYKFHELIEILKNGFVVKLDDVVRITGQVEDKDDES